MSYESRKDEDEVSWWKLGSVHWLPFCFDTADLVIDRAHGVWKSVPQIQRLSSRIIKNQLPVLLHKPQRSLSSPSSVLNISSSVDSPFSPSTIPSLIHSQLKTYSTNPSYETLLAPELTSWAIFWEMSVFVSCFVIIYSNSMWQINLTFPSAFQCTIKYSILYHIVPLEVGCFLASNTAYVCAM